MAGGTRLGPYEILAPLGAGGMGEVFKARDTRLDRFVAVKVLPEHLAKDGDSLARFEREARAVAALNHPSILGVHEFETQGEISYVVMELLEGESLRTRLERGPLSPRKATELATQMSEGLAAAHEKGVVHRDLKPENLWITKEGRLKILDFGLAKLVGAMGARSDSYAPTAAPSPGHRTDDGMILGTLGYMSPEQVRGEAVDGRSDIFSFGVVLFEMLTARRAFARSTASDTLAAILRDDPPEIEGTSRPIPPGLQHIVNHCLEKRPEERFHSAHDLGFALQNLSSAEGSAAPLAAPFAPQNRRTTRIWGALAAVLFAGAGLAGWALRGGPAPLPTFRPLTNERGTLSAARFVPNSPEVIYSAQWAGGASQWYARRLDQPGTLARCRGAKASCFLCRPTGRGSGSRSRTSRMASRSGASSACRSRGVRGVSGFLPASGAPARGPRPVRSRP
ncbi:MAG: serine/threonine-protein kinase [Solirubrobacterales bacterium]